jgi:hypothetical protein
VLDSTSHTTHRPATPGEQAHGLISRAVSICYYITRVNCAASGSSLNHFTAAMLSA